MPHTWLQTLQHAFDAFPETPANPDHAWPEVRVLAASNRGNRLELELRFRSGTLYCCAEPGCFLPDHDPAWWAAIRARIHERIDRDPPPFIITVRGIVEDGARLAVNAQLGLPVTVGPNTYTHTIRESRPAHP